MYLAGVDCLLSFLESVSNWLWHHTVQEFVALAPFFFKFFHVLLKGSSFVGFLNNRQFIVVSRLVFCGTRDFVRPMAIGCYPKALIVTRGHRMLPEGHQMLPEGTGHQMLPEGTGHQMLPDGTGHQMLPECTGHQMLPECTGHQMLPEGSKCYLRAKDTKC